MSFIYPVSPVNLSQGFGDNSDYYAQYGQVGHNGYDLSCSIGTPVYASSDGTVYYEGWGVNQPLMGSIAGICVIIDHGSVMTGYAHMSTTIVNAGQSVVQGQLIGYSGSTGTSTGGHVHFEFIAKPVNKNNGYYGRVDPSQYLQGDSTNMVDKNYVTALWIDFFSVAPSQAQLDQYVGKVSLEVAYNDVRNSAAYKQVLAVRVAQLKDLNDKITALTKAVTDITTQLNNANKEIASLKGQPSTSVVSDTPLDKENNSLLKQILALLQSLVTKISNIFKGE